MSRKIHIFEVHGDARGRTASRIRVNVGLVGVYLVGGNQRGRGVMPLSHANRPAFFLLKTGIWESISALSFVAFSRVLFYFPQSTAQRGAFYPGW